MGEFTDLITEADYRHWRAQRVLHLLHQMWGDDLPPGPDAEMKVLIDAVAGDDHLGAQDGYIVQSDRLTYDAVALLLRRCSTPAVAARVLPPDLLMRLFSSTTLSHTHPTTWPTASDVPGSNGTGPHAAGPHAVGPNTTDPPATGHMNRWGRRSQRRAPRAARQSEQTQRQTQGQTHGQTYEQGPEQPRQGELSSPARSDTHHPEASAGLPPQVGTWHLDADARVLSWDEASAALLGRHDRPQHGSVVEEMEVWIHPADRSAVLDGFEQCIHTARPHQVQFRALSFRGRYVSCLASGRRIVDASGRVHVVGVMQQGSQTNP